MKEILHYEFSFVEVIFSLFLYVFLPLSCKNNTHLDIKDGLIVFSAIEAKFEQFRYKIIDLIITMTGVIYIHEKKKKIKNVLY